MMGNLPEDSQDYKDLNKYTAAKFISNPETVQDLPDLAKGLVLSQLMKALKTCFIWVLGWLFYVLSHRFSPQIKDTQNVEIKKTTTKKVIRTNRKTHSYGHVSIIDIYIHTHTYIHLGTIF